jgi:hypothetical protein
MNSSSAERPVVTCCRGVTVLAGLLLYGCATATYQPTAKCSTTGGDIKVLTTMPPPGTYKVCGSVSTLSPALADAAESIKAAQDEVRRYGGNAIVITKLPTADISWAEGYHRKGGAIVIEID